MVIMTHSHSRNTQQDLRDAEPNFVHILYSDEVQWKFDVHEIDFGFVPRCG